MGSGKSYRGADLLLWRYGSSGEVEVLLGKRSSKMNHAPGYWSTFGGGMHWGEDFLTCALREATEETMGEKNSPPVFSTPRFGVDPKPLRIVHWTLGFEYEFHTFACQVMPGTPDWFRTNDEVDAFAWVGPRDRVSPLHGQARKSIRALHQLLAQNTRQPAH